LIRLKKNPPPPPAGPQYYQADAVADLQLKNLLLPGPETRYLARFEKAEVTDPSPRKMLKDRTIYKALSFIPRGGLSLLADFGKARMADKEHNEDIVPNVYRAPEVMLRSSWDYKVDI
jgi:non-specific serine/threonine protein kinase